jgi:hypothetical protein
VIGFSSCDKINICLFDIDFTTISCIFSSNA